jgi:hypothetical protein
MIAPSTSFDFLSATLSNKIAISRAGATATQVNSLGLIEAVPADTARFDYDPITLLCKGLLIEESRVNLWTYSEDFNQNTAWLKTAASITVDATTSPDGSVNADKIIRNSGATSVQNLVRVSPTGFPNTVHAASIFVKKAEWKGFLIFARNSNDTATSSFIDLETKTTTINNHNVTIENFKDDWIRVKSLHRTSSGTLNVYYSPLLSVSDNGTGDGSSGIYIWGGQLEESDFHTSYVSTVASTVTRNADVATITGTDFSDWWQAGRGGVSVSAIPSTVIGTRPLIQFDDATADNLIALQGNTTNPELYIVDSTTPQAQIDAGTIAAGTPYTLTGWWQTDFCAARKDNGARVVDNSATIPTVTQARLGSDGTNYLNGHLATINYYDQFSSRIYTRRKNKAVFSVL